MRLFSVAFISFWIAWTPTLAKPVEEKAPSVPVTEKTPVKDVIGELKEKIRQNPKDPKLVVKLAEEYQKNGDHSKTTTLLWAQIDKLDASNVFTLIKSHEALKEWNEVGRAASMVLSKNSNDEKALTYLGLSQFKKGKPTDAKESLKKALEINPKYQPAYEILSLIYEKNPYEQRLLYQDMVSIFGPKADFLTKLCRINTDDGENEQGDAVCRQAIVANSKIAENHVNLGIIAKQKDEPDQARKLFKQAADQFPKSEYAQYHHASFLESEKNWVDAFKYYDLCLQADPESERCLVGLGNSGVQVQKFEKSYEAFKLACRKAGRKNSASVRKASSSLRQRKESEWSIKFEDLAERCSLQ